MPRRFIMLSLLVALSALSTGCCGRIRQCIANRWHAHHPYAGGGGACCTPAFKVPAQYGVAGPVGCATCGPEGGAIVYQGPISGVPAGVPTLGHPTPLIGSEHVPSTMPPKKN